MAGRGRSRVSVPTAATTITAPKPAKNQPVLDISGYKATEASTVAAAAATVSRWFTWLLRPARGCRAGRPDG
jgi:hypothetical protein